jgi:uncharacterized protein
MMKFQNPHVCDLAWAISSPPLLLPDASDCRWYSNEWYRSAGAESTELMIHADRHPQSLESMLAERSDRRLGNYFETLWAYWLSANPRFELLGRNLQINDQGRTLGELDFIVLDRAIGKCLHWEVAVKFYLGRGDTSLQCNWLGPGRKDRLDLKVGHLLNRQLKLGSHPLVREWCDNRGIRIDAHAVILKGRLYYPLDRDGQRNFPHNANPRHLRSRWLTQAQFCRLYSPERRFVPLTHGGWMEDMPALGQHSAYRADRLVEMLESGELRLPLHVCEQNGAINVDRLFIVSHEWADEKT